MTGLSELYEAVLCDWWVREEFLFYVTGLSGWSELYKVILYDDWLMGIVYILYKYIARHVLVLQ